MRKKTRSKSLLMNRSRKVSKRMSQSCIRKKNSLKAWRPWNAKGFCCSNFAGPVRVTLTLTSNFSLSTKKLSQNTALSWIGSRQMNKACQNIPKVWPKRNPSWAIVTRLWGTNLLMFGQVGSSTYLASPSSSKTTGAKDLRHTNRLCQLSTSAQRVRPTGSTRTATVTRGDLWLTLRLLEKKLPKILTRLPNRRRRKGYPSKISSKARLKLWTRSHSQKNTLSSKARTMKTRRQEYRPRTRIANGTDLETNRETTAEKSR